MDQLGGCAYFQNADLYKDECVSVLEFYITCNDISVIYVTAQMCRRTEEVVVLRSGSQRHRHNFRPKENKRSC